MATRVRMPGSRKYQRQRTSGKYLQQDAGMMKGNEKKRDGKLLRWYIRHTCDMLAMCWMSQRISGIRQTKNKDETSLLKIRECHPPFQTAKAN